MESYGILFAAPGAVSGRLNWRIAMRKALGFGLLFAASSVYSMAGAVVAPEIDPASGVAALALLAGGLLVLRTRRSRRL